MRKYITKEITFTTCKVSELQIIKGKPTVIECDPERFIGALSEKNIKRQLKRMYGRNLTPYDIKTESNTYQLPIEKFVEHATIKGVELP